jgi:hypothetical protein
MGEWQPHASTRSECNFTKWNEDHFCKLAHNKTIAFAGDSLTWEHFKDIVHRFGHKAGNAEETKSMKSRRPVIFDACNASTTLLLYQRDNKLGLLEVFAKDHLPDAFVLN